MKKKNKDKSFLDMCELSENNFYPPDDNRMLKSNVRGVFGGDNFLDYLEYMFDMVEELELFEN